MRSRIVRCNAWVGFIAFVVTWALPIEVCLKIRSATGAAKVEPGQPHPVELTGMPGDKLYRREILKAGGGELAAGPATFVGRQRQLQAEGCPGRRPVRTGSAGAPGVTAKAHSVEKSAGERRQPAPLTVAVWQDLLMKGRILNLAALGVQWCEHQSQKLEESLACHTLTSMGSTCTMRSTDQVQRSSSHQAVG